MRLRTWQNESLYGYYWLELILTRSPKNFDEEIAWEDALRDTEPGIWASICGRKASVKIQSLWIFTRKERRTLHVMTWFNAANKKMAELGEHDGPT